MGTTKANALHFVIPDRSEVEGSAVQRNPLHQFHFGNSQQKPANPNPSIRYTGNRELPPAQDKQGQQQASPFLSEWVFRFGPTRRLADLPAAKLFVWKYLVITPLDRHI